MLRAFHFHVLMILKLCASYTREDDSPSRHYLHVHFFKLCVIKNVGGALAWYQVCWTSSGLSPVEGTLLSQYLLYLHIRV